VSAYKPGQETPSTRLGVFFYQEYNITKEGKVMVLQGLFHQKTIYT